MTTVKQLLLQTLVDVHQSRHMSGEGYVLHNSSLARALECINRPPTNWAPINIALLIRPLLIGPCY